MFTANGNKRYQASGSFCKDLVGLGVQVGSTGLMGDLGHDGVFPCAPGPPPDPQHGGSSSLALFLPGVGSNHTPHPKKT